MKSEDLKKWQKFLDKISIMTITQVDDTYLRRPDNNDKFGEDEKIQIHHYGFEDFRIHGYWDEGIFYVIRLDPKHNYHK